MIRSSMSFGLASVVVIVASAGAASDVNAQCNTCATPTVAYHQPTVAYYQPTVAYQPVATQQVRTGWYLGRWFDRSRMRRWGASTAAAPAYTTAYTPYTAAYAYAPTSYTAAYRPYVTAYAPLSYTVARPVVMSPIGSACGTCGSDPCGCSPCGGCGSCSSCSSGVGQAIYSGSSTGCATCATGTGAATYSDSAPATPQPRLKPDEVVPGDSLYNTQRPESTDGADDPSPDVESSTFLEPPQLINPNDRSANRPTVEVHNAVYRQTAVNHAVNHAPEREVDEHGWSAVSTNR
jgi:hypothetical protein